MARPIKNPGVGRGRGPRETKEVQCSDCGKGFPAARSDAKRCPECKLANDAQRKNVERAAAGREVGVGKGAGARSPKALSCVDCKMVFTAARSDALRCEPCDRLWARERSRVFDAQRIDACPECGEAKSARGRRCKACYGKWRSANLSGENHPSWKGGRTYHKAGYLFVWDPRPEPKHRYVAQHRYVWEQAHGPIPERHIIHHLNGDKLDNRLVNLVCLSNSAHRKLHENVDGERSAYIQAMEARIRELEST